MGSKFAALRKRSIGLMGIPGVGAVAIEKLWSDQSVDQSSHYRNHRETSSKSIEATT